MAVLDAESKLDAFAADITLRRALGDRDHSHLDTRIQALEEAKSDYKNFAREVQVRERISAADLLNSEDPLILPELLGGILASIEVRVELLDSPAPRPERKRAVRLRRRLPDSPAPR